MAQIHSREIAAAEGDLVHQLLMKSFGARSSAEQTFIVEQPRPRPSLNPKTREIGFFKMAGTIKKIGFVEAKA